MTDEDERWMRRAIAIARYAALEEPDPFTPPLGSVIMQGCREIAAERNQTQELPPDATVHPEMMAIPQACRCSRAG